MEGSLSGLAILQEMAQKTGMMHNFIADAKGIAGETLNRAIYEMKQRCYGIVNSDGTNRAATLAARYHARHYGSGAVDTDNLSTMKQFANEADFLAAVLPAGVNASYFAEAVNN